MAKRVSAALTYGLFYQIALALEPPTWVGVGALEAPSTLAKGGQIDLEEENRLALLVRQDASSA